ncbi:hypothetical protein [Longirhabdus pacifica]|uniref:hypothetical protein n=1 Tax=Longirhabdus pacifica TaxID=2305227 RepID=UPI001009287D|nr:hypothetical protein [Longirhabdus pacifica]
MSNNKTNHLNLNVWESSDYVLHEEFNENFQTIDLEVADAKEHLTNLQDEVNDLEENVEHIKQKLADTSATTISLQRGQNIVTTEQASGVRMTEIIGRTMVNLLGSDGNCEDTSKFSVQIALKADTFQLSKADAVYGGHGIRATFSLVDDLEYGTSFYGIRNYNIKQGKHYLAAAHIKDSSSSIKGNVAVRKFNTEYHIQSTDSKLTSTLDYVTFTADGTEESVGIYFNVLANEQWCAFDGLRLYEIIESEKTYIDSLSIIEAEKYIATRYPYVEGLRSLTNPYVIRYGRNVIPPFSDWNLSEETTIDKDYKLTLRATEHERWSISPPISVVAGEAYAFSADTMDGNAIYQSWNDEGEIIEEEVLENNSSLTISDEAVKMTIKIGNTVEKGTGTFGFENLMLALGTAKVNFEPQNNDEMYVETVLRSSMDGEVYDSITERDGILYKNKRMDHIELTGKIIYRLVEDVSGVKKIRLSNEFLDNFFKTFKKKPNKHLLIKYNNQLLEQSIDETIKADAFTISEEKAVFIFLSDEDTGWENYNPSEWDICRYFNGWKYIDGEKWESITGNNEITNSLQSQKSMPSNYTPYQLQYELEEPIEEVIEGQLGLSFLTGKNQVEVGEGIIVQEEVRPRIFNSQYWINAAFAENLGEQLPKKNSKISCVYRDGRKDANWSIAPHNTDLVSMYGKEYAVISEYDYHSDSTYTVTYQMINSLTPPMSTMHLEYEGSLHTVVESLVQKTADLSKELTSVTNKIDSAKQYSNKLEKEMLHTKDTLLLGNNDWSPLIYDYNSEGSVAYRAEHQGIVFTDECWTKVRMRMPVDPDSTYFVKAKVKKLEGEEDTKFWLGAISLDNNYNELLYDTAHVYNYFGAEFQNISAGETAFFESAISGYNTPEENSHNKFDPDAKYWDLVVICNYVNSLDIVGKGETLIEWIEVRKAPSTFYVGDNKVLDESTIQISSDGKLHYKYNDNWYELSGIQK